ncbi:MAG: phospholipase/carboxylesterase [Myxococcota bacterium]|jgi:phospholipase/carboxylesterase
MLDTLELGPREDAAASVIWMHGLGASKHDFEALVPMLGLPDVRFVFPQAPHRPVTLNNGYVMPAWYDILSLGPGPKREEEAGIRASAAAIGALIERERERGVPDERIVLAGFSQGGAMALHTGLRHDRPLLGMLVLSAYLVLPHTVAAEANAANTATPILFCHGQQDEVVGFTRGQAAYEAVRAGRSARWEPFTGGHQVTGPEVRVIREWLHERVVDGSLGVSLP